MGIGTLLVFAIVGALLLVYALVALWPESSTVAEPTGTETVPAQPNPPIDFLGSSFRLSLAARFFAIVAIAGALGGMVHTMRSLAWYAGNRNLRWSWVSFYILLPLLGASCATLFYLVLRAGLFADTSPTDANAYGFAAVGALVGLFSEQALEKLRQVFSSILTSAPQGSDAVSPDKPEKPVVRTGKVTDITKTKATLSGTVKLRGGQARVTFVYGKTRPYRHSTKPRVVKADGEVKGAIDGLEPGQAYHFRIEAENAAGKTVGDDQTFRTEP